MSKKGKSTVKERNKAAGKSARRDSAAPDHNDGAAASSSSPRKVKVLPLECMTPDWIADVSESILESPDSAFSSVSEPKESNNNKNNKRRQSESPTDGGPVYAGKVQQLLAAAGAAASATRDDKVEAADKGRRNDISRLAILSLLAIFRDIVPSYRIRLPSVKEMAVKVSRDTKKLWDYERALLASYQEYLKIMERYWNMEKEQTAPSSLAVTSILCLCELLKAAYHFNFRSNLLSAVIRPMSHQVEPVSAACCQAIEYVFASDVQGEVALEAARMTAKMIRDKNFKVPPRVLRTFLSLPLRVHVDEAQAAKIAAAANSKKRRRDKETAAIEAELKESEATSNKIVLARAQSETLQAVTLTYFRILKSENHSEERLLSAALEGLAKFSHLINLDTVLDLLELLKGLLANVDSLPLDAALNCVLTAFSTLAGPGKELKIDVKEYIIPLYTQMKRFVSESACQHTDLLFECLNAAFVKRREFSPVRIAAFVKQIWTLALHSPPSTAIPLVAYSRLLIQRYPSVEQFLENEQDVITSGQYNPNVMDPEHSNPLATSGWELSLLRFHYHSGVVQQATGAANAKILQLPGEEPDTLRAQRLHEEEELIIPFVRNAKKHPLDPSHQVKYAGGDANTAGAAAPTKRRRIRARFVTPRHLECIYIDAGKA